MGKMGGPWPALVDIFPWLLGFSIWEEGGNFLIPCFNFAASLSPGFALVPLVAE